MLFDRLGICEAYYWYSVLWAGDRYANRIRARLDRIPFKPSSGVEFGRLTENGRDIFVELVRYWHGDEEAARAYAETEVEAA